MATGRNMWLLFIGLLVLGIIIGVIIGNFMFSKPLQVIPNQNLANTENCKSFCSTNFCPITQFSEQPQTKTWEMKIPIADWNNGVSTPQFPTEKYNCWTELQKTITVRNNQGFCKVNSFRQYPNEISLDCECWYLG